MKRESRIRLALFAGSVAIMGIVAVFLWLLNVGRDAVANATFLTYMAILGGLSLVSLGLFFAFSEVFDQEGRVYTSRIMTMLVAILMLVQLALAFSAYTNQSMSFSFQTFEHAYATVTQLDATNEAGADETLTQAATAEFSYMAIADKQGVVKRASDQAMVGQPAPDDGALSFILYSGNRLLAKPSESYHAGVVAETIIGQITLLVISLMFTVEFVMFIVGRVSRIGESREERERTPAILTGVRQTAFLFYFASRLSATFIPIMARGLPAGSLPVSATFAAALPQTAETLFTCFAILFTNRLLTRRGWRPPFLLGLALVMLGTLLCAFAPTLPLFTATRAMIGLGYGFCWMTLRSAALFGKDEEARMRGFSMLNAGLYAGMFCGSTVGSIIAVRFGYETVLLISAALTALCAVNILTMKNLRLPSLRPSAAPSPARGAVTARDRWSFGCFLLLMVAPSCIVVAYSGYYLPLFYDELGRSALDVGRAQLLYGLLIVYLGPALSRLLAKRLHNQTLCNFLYNALLATGLIALGASGQFSASLFAIVLIALGDGFGFGAQNTYFLAMPVNRRLGDNRALMYLSLSKKLMEMLGPAAFALVTAGVGARGVGVMGAAFLLAACAYVAIDRLLHRHVREARV